MSLSPYGFRQGFFPPPEMTRKEQLCSSPPQMRTYLDSLVVTSAESWFAASQSQASACAASPPSCSLMHLQDRVVQRWAPSEPVPVPLPHHSHQQSHPSQGYSQATATDQPPFPAEVVVRVISKPLEVPERN